jgi:hypothetical protein
VISCAHDWPKTHLHPQYECLDGRPLCPYSPVYSRARRRAVFPSAVITAGRQLLLAFAEGNRVGSAPHLDHWIDCFNTVGDVIRKKQ